MKKTTLLSKLLKTSGVLTIPAAYYCVSVRIVETVGCKAVVMSSSITGDNRLGIPNIGLPIVSKIITYARYIMLIYHHSLILCANEGYSKALADYSMKLEVIRVAVS